MTRDLQIPVPSGVVVVRLICPPVETASPDPLLLLTFCADRDTALSVAPWSIVPDYFLSQGHRVASFDLPNHGDRRNQHGEGLVGMRNALMQGEDPFGMFVQDGIAVIDHLLAQGLARPARIVVSGTSRGGYLALRLLAADPRIAAGAALAPVTDWRILQEFEEVRERPEVAALRLTQFVDSMAGRPVYIAIGNHDGRVSTARCCEFFSTLFECNARRGYDESLVEFLVRSAPGHSCDKAWHTEAARFLVARTP